MKIVSYPDNLRKNLISKLTLVFDDINESSIFKDNKLTKDKTK